MFSWESMADEILDMTKEKKAGHVFKNGYEFDIDEHGNVRNVVLDMVRYDINNEHDLLKAIEEVKNAYIKRNIDYKVCINAFMGLKKLQWRQKHGWN